MDMPQELNSDITATSKYKCAGGIPELSQTVTEQPLRWQLLQEDSFPVTQNRSSSSSSSSSSSLSTAFVDPDIKKGNILSTAERPGSQVGNIDKSNRSGTASTETKPSVLQFAEQKSTTQKIQPQIFSFSFGGQGSISDNKETELTKPVGGLCFSEASTSKNGVEASPSSVFPPVSSSSSPNLSWRTLPITSGDSGSTTSTQIAKYDNKEVLQVSSLAFSVPSEPMSSLTSTESKEVLRFPTSAISVSAPQAAPVISPSSKGTESVDSDSTKSSVNSAKEPLKISPETTANKDSSGDKLVVTQSAENLASSSSDGLNFAHLVPPTSSVEVPKAFASSPDTNKSATHVNGIVLNTQEKQPAPITSSLAFPSELGGATGGKSNIENALTQEDEMEEAPETNQTAQASLGSFAGFGIGSTPPSAAAPKDNPFGGHFASAPQTMPTVPSGVHPASFSFQSVQASQPSQSANIGAPSAFSFANSSQISSGSGFGQPSQIGSGQQASGSVLGSFGQSRQLGSGLPGSGFGVPQSPGGGFGGGFATAAAGGGFAAAAAATGGSGFAAAAPSGGFAGAAPSGGGFAAAAPSVGGFASAGGGAGGFGAFGGGFATAAAGGGFVVAAATGGSRFAAAAPSGRFAAAASSGGGFAAAAPSVGGFAAAGGGGGAGGFGAFGNTGTSGFAGFGGGAGGRQAPSELFTQMRK